MKNKCCYGCIVDPMCTSGCHDLWEYYASMKKRWRREHKYSRRSVNTLLVLAAGWNIGCLTGVISFIDGTSVFVVTFIGASFWYGWYWFVYAIPLSIFLFFMVRNQLVRKMIRRIELGKRGEYISMKTFEEQMKENKKERR